MKIADVIDKADRWQPNVFDLKDKLDWCYEVTRDLMLDNPEFLSATKTVTSDGGIVPLPEGVLYSDVAEVYVNGARVERLDERTMEDAQLKRGDQVYVVYRYFPPVYALSDDGEVPEDLETVCGAPFDDAEEYNKFISAYNAKFYAYKNFCGANSPVSVRKGFVNYF